MASGRVWSGLGLDARASQRLIFVSALPVCLLIHQLAMPYHKARQGFGMARRTRNNHRVTLPRKLNCLDPGIMSTPPSYRHALLNIPQKHRPVPAHTREPRVVPRDCDVEHRIPVCLVPLDRTR